VLQLVLHGFLVEFADILQCLYDLVGHCCINVAHVAFGVPDATLNKLHCVGLVHVVLQPRKVELVVAKADKIEQRLDIVNWICRC
jgi:hypothetical protein